MTTDGRDPVRTRRMSQSDVRTGDVLTAQRYNELTRIVRSIVNDQIFGGLPLRHHLPAGAIQFRLKSSNGAYWTCRRFDGTTEGSTDVYIAKPWELRTTTTGIGSQTYSYTNDRERVATDSPDTETQVLVPDYVDDESIIMAARADYTGVVGPSSEPLLWIDLNVAGRSWAKKSGT